MTVYVPYDVSAPTVVGGSTSLGDESDSTYVEVVYTVSEGVGSGSTAQAFFDPLPGYDWEQMRMRFEVFNASGGTGTHTIVTARSNVTGDLIGNFYRPGDSDAITEVAATDTIYDYTDWLFEQVDPDVSLSDALADGLRVQVRRNPFSGSTPIDPGGGEYGVRIYELTLGVAEVPVTTSAGVQPRRIFQRSL
jgi:hypothetical protein